MTLKERFKLSMEMIPVLLKEPIMIQQETRLLFKKLMKIKRLKKIKTIRDFKDYHN